MTETPNNDDKIITNINKQDDGQHIICRPWITLRNGQRLYASSVGKKAFCFPVSEEKSH